MKIPLLATLLALGTFPALADDVPAKLVDNIEEAVEPGEDAEDEDVIPPSKPEEGEKKSSTPTAEEITKLQAELAKRPPSDPVKDHKDGSTRVSKMQDELAADVRQLILEQTAEQVIQKFEEADFAMDDATDRLVGHDTGGETMAAQTEVIEKLYEAAKKRKEQQQQQQSGKPNSQQQDSGSDAMLEMMERMMGKEPGQGEGEKPAQQPGNQGGEGMTGDSNTGNQHQEGVNGGNTEQRTVPKASGTAGKGLPPEFQQALDAYNRGASRLAREPQRK